MPTATAPVPTSSRARSPIGSTSLPVGAKEVGQVETPMTAVLGVIGTVCVVVRHHSSGSTAVTGRTLTCRALPGRAVPGTAVTGSAATVPGGGHASTPGLVTTLVNVAPDALAPTRTC